MGVKRSTVLAALAAGLLAASPAPAQERAPPAGATDLGEISVHGLTAPVGETFLVERAELSPDGTRVAYVAALGNERRLRVEALDGSLVRMADLKDAPLRDLFWAGDDRIILILSFDALDFVAEDNGLFMGLTYNVASNSWETLVHDRTEMAKSWLGVPTAIERTEAVFPLLFERPIVRLEGGKARVFADAIERGDGERGAVCRYNLYETDLDVGSTRRVSIGVTRRQARAVGPENRLVAVVQEGRLLLARGAGWRRTDVAGEPPLELLGLGATPDTVLVRVGQGSASRLLEVPLEDDPVPSPVEVEDLTGAEPIYDDGGVLIGFEGRLDDGRRGYRWVEPRLAAVWGAVLAAFPGDAVSPASWSADFSRLIVYAERADGSDYHLVDVAAGTSVLLAPSYPERDGAQLDRTGNLTSLTIRRAAAARISNPRNLCWPTPE